MSDWRCLECGVWGLFEDLEPDDDGWAQCPQCGGELRESDHIREVFLERKAEAAARDPRDALRYPKPRQSQYDTFEERDS